MRLTAEAGEIHFDSHELQALFTGADGGVAKDLEKRGQSVERAAKRYAPVDTGRLRASITHQLGKDSEGLFCDIGTDVEYAPPQEFGTIYMEAHPFLRPALGEQGGGQVVSGD